MSRAESQPPPDSPAADRRRMLRQRVLLSGAIADESGENAIACSILEINGSGAKIQLSSWTLQHHSEVYLVDTRSEMAHFATVVWTDADRTGLSFVRSYSLDLTLPPRMAFLRKLLVETKLRQVRALTYRGIQVEEAASALGLSEDYLERFGMRGLFDEKVALLLHEAKRLFSQRTQDRSRRGRP
jgi:hypothetical protein